MFKLLVTSICLLASPVAQAAQRSSTESYAQPNSPLSPKAIKLMQALQKEAVTQFIQEYGNSSSASVETRKLQATQSTMLFFAKQKISLESLSHEPIQSNELQTILMNVYDTINEKCLRLNESDLEAFIKQNSSNLNNTMNIDSNNNNTKS